MSAAAEGGVGDELRRRLQASLGTAFTVERELGGGGMSRVFVARDEKLARQVVVKVLAPELAEGLSAERFTREIRLAAALQEPHIVPVLAAGATADGLPWYTMPFVEGESLRARLASGTLPVGEAVSILRNVAKALAYAHARGVVHRDIKPENVLLSSGTAVVTDFGIAKALSASKTLAPGGPAGAATLTQVGTSLGSPAYMAREQAAGDDVDARADIYAWGVMAYELLAGRHPFADRKTAQQLIAAQIAEAPRQLFEVAPAVPAPLAAVVMRALAKGRAGRPASSAELLGLQAAALQQTGDTAAAWPALSRALTRAPRSAGLRSEGFWTTLGMRRYEDAGDLLARVRDLLPESAAVYLDAAVLANALGDSMGVARALREYRTHGGLFRAGSDALYLMRRADVALQNELANGSPETFDAASADDSATFYRQKVQLFIARGDAVRARALADSGYRIHARLAAAPSTSPRSKREALFLLAGFAAARGERAEALSALERAGPDS